MVFRSDGSQTSYMAVEDLNSALLPPVCSPLFQDELDSFLQGHLSVFFEVPQFSHGIATLRFVLINFTQCLFYQYVDFFPMFFSKSSKLCIILNYFLQHSMHHLMSRYTPGNIYKLQGIIKMDNDRRYMVH
jgi:hypothetical protein